MGTELCGLPRGGTVSAMLSHGSILGCCLKSVNQEQPVIRQRTDVQIHSFTRDDISAPRSLALTAHLPRTVATQQFHRLVGAIGGRPYPNAVVAGAEARIVTHGRS